MNIAITEVKEEEQTLPDNLDEYLSSKYQNVQNTESNRRNILRDIEAWCMRNVDVWEWERNGRYREFTREQVEKIKFEYYYSLVEQSGLDEQTKRQLIINYN